MGGSLVTAYALWASRRRDQPLLRCERVAASIKKVVPVSAIASEGSVLTRLARLCYRYRFVVLAGWALVFVAGIALGGAVTERLSGGRGSNGWESVRGYRVLGDNAQYGTRLAAIIDNVPATDPTLIEVVTRVRTDLLARPDVGRVLDPYGPALGAAARALVATNGRAVMMTVDLKRGLDDAARDRAIGEVETVLRGMVGAAPGAVPGATVTVGGDRLLQDEVNQQTSKDTQLGEAVALPLTLIVMVLIFGGFLAAGVPLIGALVAISGGLLSLYGFSEFMDLEPSVLSVTTVLGLGLAIDYSLLMVSRFREERAAGLTAAEAIERTAATAGRTIVFSACIVGISISGLFVFPSPIFRAIAAAGSSVVAVSLLIALTLTPALLGLLHRRIKIPPPPPGKHRGRRPVTGADHRASAPRPEPAVEVASGPAPNEGFFATLARAVQRRAIAVTIVVGVILVGAGVPFLGVNFQNSSAGLLPASFESRRFADLAAERFVGQREPEVTVVAQIPTAELQRWAEDLADDQSTARWVDQVGRAQQLGDRSVISVVPTGPSDDPGTAALVERMRAQRPSADALVTGDAAALIDFQDEIVGYAPWALGVVALAVFVLLFLMTGSVLVPIKALVMNSLSLTASFGALVLVFQEGWGSDLLGFESTGGLELWVPVIVFAFAFGLSMDYEVFLLARIKELYDTGMSNDDAVRIGLQRSGRIITSAALLVFIVFAGFAAGKMLGIKELGMAMAIAVAVDATLVRCLLVPATMTLLGRANWWAPAPLRQLHQLIGVREAVDAPVSPAPGPAAAPEAAAPGPTAPEPAAPGPAPGVDHGDSYGISVSIRTE
jgi:RND superfamily putative drug exporter